MVKCGVACDAIERWWNIVSKNKEIDHKTHQMLILHKITTDNLPPNLTSTHQFSRVLERALFSFADDFSLIKKDAKAGEGGWKDLLNRHLMTQEHVNYVAKLLANSFANPHYVTSNVSFYFINFDKVDIVLGLSRLLRVLEMWNNSFYNICTFKAPKNM